MSCFSQANETTYAIDQIKDDPHSHTKLLKVQLPITVDVREIPHSLELVIAKLAVLENRGGLSAVEVGGTVGNRREDFPISFHFPLFNLFVRHGGKQMVRVRASSSKALREISALSADMATS